MQCNVCGGKTFADVGARAAARCLGCGSFERTRLLWLYVEKYGRLDTQTRALHLAPELGVYRRMRARLAPGHYDVRDLCPENFAFAPEIGKLDLCQLDGLPSDHYDLILHSHVLEHVPGDLAHTMYHLHRSLKPDGRHLFVVPFMPGHYDECFEDITVDERIRRFGQADHVRRFGLKDIHAHLGSLVTIDTGFDAEAEHGVAALVAANIPRPIWKGLSAHSVLHLGKFDLKLPPRGSRC